MDEVLKVDVVLVEEFAEAILIDLVPELCLFFRESARTDDNIFWAACFVVAHSADQVEGEECAVEKTAGQVSYMDATVWERKLFNEFHIVAWSGSSGEEVAECNFRILSVEGVGIEDEGFVGFHVVSMIGLGQG